MIDYNQIKREVEKIADTKAPKGYEQQAIHLYTDEAGKVLYAKPRYKNLTTSEKWLRSFHLDKDGKWQMKEPDFSQVYPQGNGKKPLYLLPDIVTNTTDTVYIFEGEQKADLAKKLGFLATTTGSSSSVNSHYWQPLAGRNTVVWRDNDMAGEKWLSDVLTVLQAIGDVDVSIIDIDKLDLPKKGDIVDYTDLLYADGEDDLGIATKIKDLPTLSDEQVIELLAQQSNQSIAQNHLLESPIAIENGVVEHSREWSQVEPFINTATPATRYPIEAFTGVLRNAIKAIAYHAQVPHAIAGNITLGALSTILQPVIKAPYSDGVNFMPVSLFILSQYPSGEGKSLANSLAYQAIANRQTQLDEQYQIDLKEWKYQKAKQKRHELEQFLLEHPEPTRTTLFVRSGTLQGILDTMLMNQQKNITWVTADCGQFFGGHSMKEDNRMFLISSLSDIWSTGEFDRMLSPRAKNAIAEIRANNVRFTVDLAGQYEVIKPALNDTMMNNQGFLPRFLFTAPDVADKEFNTPERMDNNSENDPRLTAYWQRCKALLDPLPNPEYAEKFSERIKNGRLNMTFADHHARQALADYQQSAQDRKATGKAFEHYPAYANRLAENASRIASLMAFFEGRTTLTADDIGRASLLTEYSIKERIRYTDTPATGLTDMQILLDWLVTMAQGKNPPIVNKGVISQYAPNKVRDKYRLPVLLNDLESLGYIRLEQIERKKLVYINPCLMAK